MIPPTRIPPRKVRATKDQFEIIVETLEKNPLMNKGATSSEYTVREKIYDWKKLSKRLNAEGGAVKTMEKWQKCWADFKSDTKKKFKDNSVKINKTDGGAAKTKKLTPLEERVLNLLRLGATEGLPVPESEPSSLPLLQEEESDLDMDQSIASTSSQQPINITCTPDISAKNDIISTSNKSTWVHERKMSEENSEHLLRIDSLSTSNNNPSVHEMAMNEENSEHSFRINSLSTSNKSTSVHEMAMSEENSERLIKAHNDTAKALNSIANNMLVMNSTKRFFEEEKIKLKKKKLELQERKIIALEKIANDLFNSKSK